MIDQYHSIKEELQNFGTGINNMHNIIEEKNLLHQVIYLTVHPSSKPS